MFEEQEKKILREVIAEYHALLDAALPSAAELQSVPIPAKTEKRMERLFYHQKHFYYGWVNTAAKRVACFIGALLLILATATVSVEALRESFINFVIETFERGSTIFFSDGEEEPTEIPPINPKLPEYIPEGYTVIKDMSDQFATEVIYYGEGTDALSYSQQPLGSKVTVNTEGAVYRKILVLEKYEGIIFENKGDTYLVFNDDEYMYTIIGTVSEEEILRIAGSIPFGEK